MGWRISHLNCQIVRDCSASENSAILISGVAIRRSVFCIGAYGDCWNVDVGRKNCPDGFEIEVEKGFIVNRGHPLWSSTELKVNDCSLNIFVEDCLYWMGDNSNHSSGYILRNRASTLHLHPPKFQKWNSNGYRRSWLEDSSDIQNVLTCL